MSAKSTEAYFNNLLDNCATYQGMINIMNFYDEFRAKKRPVIYGFHVENDCNGRMIFHFTGTDYLKNDMIDEHPEIKYYDPNEPIQTKYDVYRCSKCGFQQKKLIKIIFPSVYD